MANKGFYVDVEGVEKTIKKLKAYEIEKKERVREVIKKTAKNVQKGAKKRVPFDSGDTKKSIKPKYYDFGMYASVGPRLPLGWKAHFHEFGTVKMQATPFMGPAEEEERSNYLATMKKELRK